MRVHFRVVEGPDLGRDFVFDQRDRFMIGRAPTAHFQITQDAAFSRHHAMIEIDPPNVLVQDLKSTNGTYVNNERVTTPVLLKHGDTVWGGQTRIQLIIEEHVLAATEPATAAGIARTAASGSSALSGANKVAVLCVQCGQRATGEQPRAENEEVVYWCAACQQHLLETPPLPPGHRLVRRLGAGAMGAVYLTHHEGLQRQHALKMILPKAAMSARARAMFAREAAAQASLDHPRIVRVVDFQQTTPGIFCLVMEYVEGSDVEALVRARGVIEPRLASQIVIQALLGLAHAHARGIVHRDIKDSNLLVSQHPQEGLSVKVSDFGLAKCYETSGASGFTKTGTLAGTIAYMPPEQVLDFKHVKPVSDVYAMGATLYHMLTGQYPYEFGDRVDPLVMILEGQIVPVARRNPDIPLAIAAVTERALAKDIAQRFATADEMRAALAAALN